MKNHLILFFTFFCYSVLAQEGVYKVHYDFFLALGDNEHFNAELLLSPYESLFLWGKPAKKDMEEDVYEISINLNASDSIGSFTYSNKKIDSMFSRTPYIDKSSILVKEAIPRIAWSIERETKKIGPYTSQKAIGTFRGRKYTAWFTYEIPISSGPWKLSGLPGLIIKASDSTGDIQFIFKSISASTESISPNLNVDKEISIEEFVQYQRSFSNEFVKKMKSKLPRGAEVEITAKNAMEIFEPKE